VTDIAEIRKMSVPEGLQLVNEIWESIVEAPELLTITDELAAELQQRLKAHRESPEESASGESVNRQVFGAQAGLG
jgi:putative addiction module component (TIGR02574 family)